MLTGALLPSAPPSNRPHEEAGVRSAEPERVRQGYGELLFTCRVRRVIEVALGVWSRVIDRGRDHAVAHGERQDAGLEAPRRAQKMPRHGLRGRNGELPGVVAEDPLDSDRLDAVAVRRGRAVRVDVDDLVRVHVD